MITDAATGKPLPESTIQRVLFATTDVHVYQIPPLTSNKGFTASSWTAPPRPTAQEIFVARLRVIETSVDSGLSIAVVLEDSQSGDLFAAAPYISDAVVQQATDSSRFFAVRVQGEGGMKATLGIGFEDRSAAFDFGIALADARKMLAAGLPSSAASSVRNAQSNSVKDVTKDFSLKEGEKIHVQIGSKPVRPAPQEGQRTNSSDNAALFSIAPPPTSSTSQSAKDLGFDDGEFGEFQ